MSELTYKTIFEQSIKPASKNSMSGSSQNYFYIIFSIQFTQWTVQKSFLPNKFISFNFL